MLAVLSSGIHQAALDATDTNGNCILPSLLTNPLPKIWEVGMNVFTHIKNSLLETKGVFYTDTPNALGWKTQLRRLLPRPSCQRFEDMNYLISSEESSMTN